MRAARRPRTSSIRFLIRSIRSIRIFKAVNAFRGSPLPQRQPPLGLAPTIAKYGKKRIERIERRRQGESFTAVTSVANQGSVALSAHRALPQRASARNHKRFLRFCPLVSVSVASSKAVTALHCSSLAQAETHRALTRDRQARTHACQTRSVYARECQIGPSRPRNTFILANLAGNISCPLAR